MKPWAGWPVPSGVDRARILVVDDEEEILDIVRRYLERDGYEVILARDGNTALQLARSGVDLLIQDLMIPGPDGLEITRRLRQTGTLPILILTARAEETDRVAGLEVGADDYLTKPFSPRELVARVKALLRRSRMAPATPRGPIVVDEEMRRVYLDGEPLELTPREYDLLRILTGAPGKNFTRDELLDRVWGPEYVGDSRRVDVHISNLREKLHKPGRAGPIRSIWGVGYRWEG
ncbi:MAG: response regulator transcription factor [Candidatus Eremiobacterota bacterium]